jgi:tetratricopeptide (TPR) repeat protein
MQERIFTWVRSNGGLVAVLLLVSFVYASALSGDFVIDDVPFIKENPHVRYFSDVARYFTKGLWENSALEVAGESQYRPLNLVPIMLGYKIWGNSSLGYHFLALLLHLANTALVYLLVRKLVRSTAFAATAGACAFALHPARVESVAWVCGYVDPLVMLFLLSALLAYIRYATTAEDGQPNRRYLLLSLLAFQCALWSKEVAIAFPVLILAYDLLYRRKIDRTALLLQAALVIAYLAMRSMVLGAAGNWHDLGLAPVFRVLDYALGYAGMLLLPFYIPLHIEPPEHAVASSWGAVSALVLVLLAVVGSKVLDTQKQGAIFAVVWLAIFFWPAMLLAFYTNGFYAGRFLYVPALGWAMLIAVLCDRMMRFRVPALLTMAFLIGGYVLLTLRDIPAWHDNGRIYAKIARDSPEGALGYQGLGDFHYVGGDYPAARENYLQVLVKAKTPDKRVGALVGLGAISGMSNDLESSERYFNEAVRLNPRQSEAWTGLGNLAHMRGDSAGAITAYEKAVAIKPGNYEATMNLADVYDKIGQPQRGEMLRLRAARLPH